MHWIRFGNGTLELVGSFDSIMALAQICENNQSPFKIGMIGSDAIDQKLYGNSGYKFWKTNDQSFP